MAASPNEGLMQWHCEPSDALASTFRALPVDPSEEIQSNLRHLLKRFMERCRSTTADEEKLVRLQKCCHEPIMWYYKILDGLLQEDRPTSGFTTVSRFLKEPLQSCLVVCCLEITLYTNKLASNFDPQLLQIFSLAPYNFWKVIILVLNTKIDLTLDVSEHLVKVEEMLVESLVWTRDSPLWEEIRANQDQMPTCHQVMLLKGQEDPITKEKPEQDLPKVGLTPDLQDLTLNTPLRNGHLHMFARKVYRLMDKQLTRLCSSLNLEEDLQGKIWTCFEYSLVHHFNLLQDCPLSWLLLCATHDLTKDIKEISFMRIINCYKSQHINKNMNMLRGHPETSSINNNYHSGRLPTPNTPSGQHQQHQEEDGIATFYTQVYAPVMGHFIKKFAPASGTETPPLSPYPTPPPASSRKYRWRPGSNVFVSQLNKHTTQQQKPSGVDYVFQSSPSQRLDEINTRIRCHSKRALRFTPGEDDKDEEAGPSVKMPRTNSQSCLDRRLQDVEDDRRRSKAQDTATLPSKHLYI